MVSTKGRYALSVMIDLAIYGKGRYVTLKEIAGRLNISEKYLEQIISLLSKAGYLRSLRGNNGGYMLMGDASKYTAGDILRAAEGSLAPIVCLKGENNSCDMQDHCATLPFWENYYKVINDYVDSVTLRELADNVLDSGENNYYI